jgi:hypothetical protein
MAEQNINKESSSSSFAEKYGKKKSTLSSSQLDPTEKQDSSSSNATKESNEQKKAIDPQKRALAQYIYLIRGVDAGRNAWYYVLVERLKVQLFLKALNDEVIHLEKYGKILYSAYGDEPPAQVTQAIKDEYGIS